MAHCYNYYDAVAIKTNEASELFVVGLGVVYVPSSEQR